MINNLQNTIKTQYGREPATAQANYCGPSTLEKFKIKQTGREKLKLEAAGDGASETAALVALKASFRSRSYLRRRNNT